MIDTRRIYRIYALGQWFEVKWGSVQVDQYQLAHPFDQDFEGPSSSQKPLKYLNCEIYKLGTVVSERESFMYEHKPLPSLEGTWIYYKITPTTAISFVDLDTGERVALPLESVEAFSSCEKNEDI